MDGFIRRQTLELFRRRLSLAKTEEQRRVILKLLAEEDAKEGINRVGSEETKRVGPGQRDQ